MTKITLFNEWSKIINADNSLDKIKAREMYDALIIEYSSESREHHNTKHIEHVLNKLNELFTIYTFTQRDMNACIMAGFYHDVVYNPVKPDTLIIPDEYQSAEYAERSMRLIGFSEDFINDVKLLIMLTEMHAVNEDITIDTLLQKVFIDSDMAILGEDPFLYNQYSDGVIEEYKDIDHETFILGRKNFLTKLSKHKTIFFTEYMNHLYNDQAHANIETEIKKMNSMYVELLTKTEV